MKKLILLSLFSLSIYAESFIKKTPSGRNRQVNKLSQEEQVRTLSKCIKEIAELGTTLFQEQQQLMKQVEDIIENSTSLYTKETIKTVEEKIKTLKLCQQRIIQSIPAVIVT